MHFCLVLYVFCSVLKIACSHALLQKIFVVVVITPSLLRGGGTARTAIQVHAVNLIEIRLGERWQPILKQS